MIVLKPHAIPCLVVHPYPSNRYATTPELRELQQLTYSLKGTGAPGTAEPRTKEFVALLQRSSTAKDFFPAGAALVPVPTSRVTTLPANTESWAGFRIARALYVAGLGSSVVTALRRSTEVASSHRASPGSRPTVAEHVNSLVCDLTGLEAKDVVLVDDVLTRGSTFAACLLRLRSAGYRGSVRAVACCYTAEPPFMLPASPRGGSVNYVEGATGATRDLS